MQPLAHVVIPFLNSKCPVPPQPLPTVGGCPSAPTFAMSKGSALQLPGTVSTY